jgi:predicted DNA-binding transcriptional regulator AlpA
MASTKFAGARVMPAQFAFRSVSQGSTGKTRQTSRIRELGAALAADGLVTLDERARALGLSRSTAWAVLKANHKASGLAAGTINQMLSSPELPPHVRVTILTYVEEKLAGLYGHNKEQLSRFAAGVRSVPSRSLVRQISTDRLH